MAVPAHRRAVTWTPASPEALRLAGALRTARLTLLRTAPGSDTTPLLTEGLLPLLHRRATDASVVAAQADDSVLMPFPERRDTTRPRPAELVVLFEGCGPAPLARLRERIDAALRAVDVGPGLGLLRLADGLILLGGRYNIRLLFVFDRFEEVLMAPPDSGARDQLLDHLVQSINSKAPARFLLAVNGDAPTQARLDEFVGRLPAIVPELMWLPGDGAPADPVRQGPPLRAVARPVAPPLAPALPTLPAWTPSEPTPYHFSCSLPLAPHDPAPARPAAMSPPPRAAPNTGRGRRYVTSTAWTGMALLWLAALVVLSPSPQREPPTAASTARSPTAPASVPRPILPAVDVPVLDLIVEGEAGSRPSHLAGELARALHTDGGAELLIQPTPNVLAGLAAPASGAAMLPRLAIARHDALRAAASSAARSSSLAVVAPLYSEELRIAVRADSPLEFIHEIKGRRINIGPRTGSRALTATTLYQRLFGASMPSTADGALDTRTALSRLADSRTLDAVLLVAPGGSTDVESVPAALRQRIKWLRLDPRHPASRRALQIYVPATLQSDAGAPVATLASVAFLVTTQPVPRADADALARFVQAMCRSLPLLQRGGDAKWREVKAGLELPTGLPSAGATETAWRDCASLAEGLPRPNSKVPSGVPPPPTQGAQR